MSIHSVNEILCLVQKKLGWAGLSILLFHVASGAHAGDSGCESNILSEKQSPDKMWHAILKEKICSNDYQSAVTEVVQLLTDRQFLGLEVESDGANEVLSVETGGGRSSDPVVVWQGSNSLQIIIPNKALIGKENLKYNRIGISLKFNPDDPLQRQEFLLNLRSHSK